MKNKISVFFIGYVFTVVSIFGAVGENVSAVGTLSSNTTNISNDSKLLTIYKLDQNHPNPFNPTTSISYALPRQGHVLLKIYDISGNEVKELINVIQKAGNYNVSFNGSTFSSGIYFYSIIIDEYYSSKKMILLK